MRPRRSRRQAATYTWVPQERAETKLGFLIVFVCCGPDVSWDLGGWEAPRWQLGAKVRAGATDACSVGSTGAEYNRLIMEVLPKGDPLEVYL